MALSRGGGYQLLSNNCIMRDRASTFRCRVNELSFAKLCMCSHENDKDLGLLVQNPPQPVPCLDLAGCRMLPYNFRDTSFGAESSSLKKHINLVHHISQGVAICWL